MSHERREVRAGVDRRRGADTSRGAESSLCNLFLVLAAVRFIEATDSPVAGRFVQVPIHFRGDSPKRSKQRCA